MRQRIIDTKLTHTRFSLILSIEIQGIKDRLQCAKISSADMIQFAAFFAVVRQEGDPTQGITSEKQAILLGDKTAPGGGKFIFI